MGRRCCVRGCSKKKTEKLSIYRFPDEKDKKDERDRWIKAVPKILLKVDAEDINDESMGLCRRHWPEETRMDTSFGKDRPASPPSLFEGVQKSQLPTSLPPIRETSKTSAAARRGPIKDFPQLINEFKCLDLLTFESLRCSLIDGKKTLSIPTTVFIVADTLFIQSTDYIHGIPKFLLKIFPSLKFEAFHGGVRCTIASLSANRIIKLNSWSKLEEALRYLKVYKSCRHNSHFRASRGYGSTCCCKIALFKRNYGTGFRIFLYIHILV